jgi:hypothetical protein
MCTNVLGAQGASELEGFKCEYGHSMKVAVAFTVLTLVVSLVTTGFCIWLVLHRPGKRASEPFFDPPRRLWPVLVSQRLVQTRRAC